MFVITVAARGEQALAPIVLSRHGGKRENFCAASSVSPRLTGIETQKARYLKGGSDHVFPPS